MQKYLSSYSNLIKEWHPTKNQHLNPNDLRRGSGKKVWWICPQDHDWQTTVAKRTIRGQGCNVCYSQRKK